jgi:hypothetical protein
MARLPLYVMPGQPQHIIQRGNNEQIIFAADADYQFFRDALVDAFPQIWLADTRLRLDDQPYPPACYPAIREQDHRMR